MDIVKYLELRNNLKRLETLKKIIKTLDAKDRDLFHSYYGVGNMTMSIKLNDDFKTFKYVYESGAHRSNWDLYVFGGCGIDSKFNKTKLLNGVNDSIKHIKSKINCIVN